MHWQTAWEVEWGQRTEATRIEVARWELATLGDLGIAIKWVRVGAPC